MRRTKERLNCWGVETGSEYQSPEVGRRRSGRIRVDSHNSRARNLHNTTNTAHP